jgi:hypothetical protein
VRCQYYACYLPLWRVFDSMNCLRMLRTSVTIVDWSYGIHS